MRSIYRTAAPGQPSGPDPLLVVPGEGLRGILVGCAIPEDVLDVFGRDGQLSRHDDGDVFKLSYDYTDGDEYQPSREANRSRPHAFLFRFGLLESIEIGVYQSELFTPERLRIGSKRAEVLEALGPPCETLTYRGSKPGPSDDIETLRYRTRGIQLSVHEQGTVASFVVFQTRRPS